MAPKSKRRASNAGGKHSSKSSSDVGMASLKSVIDVETVNKINTTLEPIITVPPPPNDATSSANMSETADSSPTSADSTSSDTSADSTQLSESGKVENTSSETLDSATSGRQSSEAKRSATQKKNQKRREAAKKKLTESAESTPFIVSEAALPQVEEAKKEIVEDTEVLSGRLADDNAIISTRNKRTKVTEAPSLTVVNKVDEKEAQTTTSIVHPQTLQEKHLDNTSPLNAAVVSPIKFSLSLTEQQNPDKATPKTAPPKESSTSTAREPRRNALELQDPIWEVPLAILAKNFDKTEPHPQIDVNTVPDVHQIQDHTPGIQPRQQHPPQHRKPSDDTPSEFQPDLSLADSYLQSRRVISSESIANLHSWDVASETVVMVAIYCLTKDKDMELSYVAILSAINVLNSKQEHEQVQCDDEIENEQVIAEARSKVGAMYSQLVRIMIGPVMAENLTKEIDRQGVMTSDALYLQLHQAIVGAGFPLRDDDHVHIAQFLFERQRMEEALSCLQNIDQWYGAVFRIAISCHLFSKPRHLHEAEVLLDRYLAHTTQTSAIGAKDRADSVSLDSKEEERRVDKAMVKKWFKLQLDASKWEETRLQYERSRARLVEAPMNIVRFSATVISPPEELSRPSFSASSVHGMMTITDKRPTPGMGPTPSSMATAGVKPESIPEQLQNPSYIVLNAPGTLTATPAEAKPSSFSFFSKNPTKAAGRRTSAPALTVGTSSIQTNRHLTILDNGMLEECVNHKQFEYGWQTVYERMGPALEDRDTAKIAMRLCKRAFLGHGGLGPNLPGSPNLLARDMYFAEDDHYHGKDISDYSNEEEVEEKGRTDDDSNEGRLKERIIETIEQRTAVLEQNRKSRQDPEIWEARAWVIYNKSTMNPSVFLFNATPTASPTGTTQYPLTQQPQQQQSSNVSTTSTSVTSSAAANASVLGLKIQPATTGTTSLAVFLHNIFTVAINSPEQSSRYTKAFRIYSSMRNEPSGQFQAQLRDPFVMTCMVKIIYDAVLTAVRAQPKRQQSLTLPSSHNRQQSQNLSQQSIGPLLDLVFEIFADMRNMGPIRSLSQLCTLAPSTPVTKSPRTPSLSTATSTEAAPVSANAKSSDGMFTFFQRSSRLRTASTVSAATIDPSACGQESAGGEEAEYSCVLQDLNPTFSQPVGQARRLPNEIYLALLHLCIQVPCPLPSTTTRSAKLGGAAATTPQTSTTMLEKSSKETAHVKHNAVHAQARAFQVVKAVITDMMATKAGQQPANLDRHLAVALQYYHDHCLPLTASCRRPPPQPKASMETIALDTNGQNDESIVEEPQNQECPFHGWMYQTGEEARNHGFRSSSSSSSSSASSSFNDLHGAHGPLSAVSLEQPNRTSSSSSHLSEDRNSHYGISKNDADLDELDLYLSEAAAAATAATAAAAVAASKAKLTRSNVDVGHQDMSDFQQWCSTTSADTGLNENKTTTNAKIIEALNGSWMDGLDHDTCNDRFYWDLWARESPLLQRVRFSRRQARMLWRHFANIDITE